MGDLWPLFNLKWFNGYMYISTFKMPTIRQVWQLHRLVMFFSIDLKDAYLHIPIVKHQHHFLWFVWQHKPYQWKVFPFVLASAIGFSPHHTYTYIVPLLLHRFFVLLFSWMVSWSLFTLSMLARELEPSGALYWFILDYILNFPSRNSMSCSNFLFFFYCVGIQWTWLSLPSDKLIEIQQLAYVLLQRQPITINQVMAFWARPPFVPMDVHNFTNCTVSFIVTCWMFTLLLLV